MVLVVNGFESHVLGQPAMLEAFKRGLCELVCLRIPTLSPQGSQGSGEV